MRELEPHDVGVSVSYPLPGTGFYEQVRSQLGRRAHWIDSSDLAMLFDGAYTTPFYRRVRDLLHDEAEASGLPSAVEREDRRAQLDREWAGLEHDSEAHRAPSHRPSARSRTADGDG